MTNKLLSNNDFPKIGILGIENSGENLLRWYLESIFDIKSISNIRNYSNKLFNNPVRNTELELKSEECWVIYSDYPIKDKNPYFKSNLSYTNNSTFHSNYYPCDISLGILLMRNPVDLIMTKLINEYGNSLKHKDSSTQFDFDIIDDLIDDWKTFIQYWIESPIPIHLIRYEDLISDPNKVLKNLLLFMIGVETIDSTLLEAKLLSTLNKTPEGDYFALNVELDKNSKSIFSNKTTVLKIQNKFDDQLFECLQQFNYEESNSKWIIDFNLLSLKDSIAFHLAFDSNCVNSTYEVLSLNSD